MELRIGKTDLYRLFCAGVAVGLWVAGISALVAGQRSLSVAFLAAGAALLAACALSLAAARRRRRGA